MRDRDVFRVSREGSHESQQREAELEGAVLRPLTHLALWEYLGFVLLVGLIALGFVAYMSQLKSGLIVTGMRDTVIWGLYISNFVFFSGLSMAGTFISAILRMTGAEWRRPLTRIAELTTVAALLMCGLNIIMDIGRPDRMLNLIKHGRLESPLIWDVLAISTYLVASAIYLYLFLIPDAAIVRDRLKGKVPRVRQWFYNLVAMRWQAFPEQQKLLARGAAIMMIIIVPIGVSVHSVVSWIFGMTFRAGWNSTIFAPYFAVGALYSGVALLITVMFIIRRAYHLEQYFTQKHFRYLGYLMIVFGVVYLYFTFAEYLTVAYKLEGGERLLLEELFLGRYSLIVWPSFLGGQILPILLAALPWTRSIPILFVASLLVNVGMWIKRFIIVVPSLSLPQLPYAWGVYTPTWVEITISFATLAGFVLVIAVFAKLFPIISLWEMKEGWEKESVRRETAPVAGGLAPRPAMLSTEGGGDGHA